MYNTVQALENWDMGPVSQKPRNFLRLFVATIPFILYNADVHCFEPSNFAVLLAFLTLKTR